MRLPKIPHWVSYLSIAATFLSIAGPDITKAIPTSAKYVMLATTLLQALAHSIGSEGNGNTVSDNALRILLAFALMPLLLAGTFTMAACGASELQRVVAKSNNVITTVRSLDPVAQLVAERLITEAEGQIVRERVDRFATRYGTFDARLTALVKADPHASLVEVVPLFADALASLNEVGAIPFTNPLAAARLNQILAGVRLGATFIAAFFASHLHTATEFIKRAQPEWLDRTELALAGVAYDKQRLKDARRTLKDGRERAPERAVCGYFGIEYDQAQIDLLESYAAQAPNPAS